MRRSFKSGESFYKQALDAAAAEMPVLWQQDTKDSYTRIFEFPDLKISSNRVTRDPDGGKWQAAVIAYDRDDWNPSKEETVFFLQWTAPTYILGDYSDDEIKIFSGVMNKALNKMLLDTGFGAYRNTWSGDGKGEIVVKHGGDAVACGHDLARKLEKMFVDIEASFNKAIAAAE